MSIVKAEHEDGKNSASQFENASRHESDDDSDDDKSDDSNSGDIATTSVTTTTKDNNKDNEHSQGDEHRSAVADFVQGLKDDADKMSSKGIGDQVRLIATEQEQSIDRISEAAEKLEHRGRFVKFLIGPSHDSIETLKTEITDADGRIARLKAIADAITNPEIKASLIAEITNLEAEKTKLNDLVSNNESAKSMFGWLVKLFK